MEKKALYNLSYGVFMLSTRSGEKVNGCITNTCMQVARMTQFELRSLF